MTLVDQKTGVPIQLGDKRQTFRGEECEVIGWETPHRPDSSGRVSLRFPDGLTHSYYPSVVNAEFRPREDR